MSTNPFFWDCIANHYAKKPVADEASYQRKLKETQQYLNPESHVLEFGCGTGTTTIIHAPYVSSIHATDISSKMLNFAETKAKAAGASNITFEQGTLMKIHVAAESWDAVLGMSILHLLADWEAHIAKVFDLLKPGGVFITSTVCIADMKAWFKLVAPLFRLLPILPSVQVFSQKRLVTSMIKAGFVVETEWRPGLEKAVFIVARKP